MDEDKEYSVIKEMKVVFAVGFVIGLIILVVSVGLIEFLKR